MKSTPNSLKKKDKTNFFSGYFTLILVVAFVAAFFFSIPSINSDSSFLGAIRYKFSKTPGVLTLGEQLIDCFSYLSPLLLAIAFFSLFCISDKLPSLTCVILSIATLISVAGIALFACLNTYNIIELFNANSNAKHVGPEMKAYYTNTLIVLVSYQIVLPIFAGTLVRFICAVRKTILTDTSDTSGTLPFAVANLLLAIWHTLSLGLSSRLMKEYFERTQTDSTFYYVCEIIIILCSLLLGAFAHLYHLKGKIRTTA